MTLTEASNGMLRFSPGVPFANAGTHATVPFEFSRVVRFSLFAISQFSCCFVVLTAASKGKYVALAVLLPRVGAARMLELCHSFVEQLVWAVGVRGNVSGQAVSLLLQFLKALSTEVSSCLRENPHDGELPGLPT